MRDNTIEITEVVLIALKEKYKIFEKEIKIVEMLLKDFKGE